MKFVHFADAHLDSPFLGLSFLPAAKKSEILQAADRSLQKIVDLALQERADLVLIAGDTFNSAHPSPHSQLFFARQMQRLTSSNIQVVMVFGNHDHLDPRELLMPASPCFHLLGARQKIEQVKLQTQAGFPYLVTGFSYLQNHIAADLAAKMPAKDNDLFSIGLFHAALASSNQAANVYAPFTMADLNRLGYDYFALGHIHHRQIISQHPLAVYPGNIQGRQSNELGAKGCYLAQVDEQTRQIKLRFVPTGQPNWQLVQAKLTGKTSKEELDRSLVKQINAQLTGENFVCLQLQGAQFLSADQTDLVQDQDYWEDLSRRLIYGSWLVNVNLASSQQLHLAAQDEPAFAKAAQEVLTPKSLAAVGKDLAKKSVFVAHRLQDPSFQANIFNLARTKLQRYLWGLADENKQD